MLRSFAFAALLGLGAASAEEAQLYPCKCRELSLEGHVEYATVIASAVVTDTDDRFLGPWWCRFLSLFKEQYGHCRLAWVSLKPTQLWKGDIGLEFGTYVDTSPDGCGPFFEKGKEYVVFVAHTLDGAFTSGCSGTRLLSEADEFLRQLGPPRETY